jgi:hypothetical protein
MVQKHDILRRKQEIIVVEMDFWRRLARISKKDKIPSHAIRENMGLQNSILDYIKQNNMARTRPKNDRQQMAQTIPGVDINL